jgi:hypothetical protein
MARKRRRGQQGGFSRQSFTGIDFSNRELSNSDFSESTLTGCDFCNSELQGASFAGGSLTGCDFSNADLSGANLQGASLTGCDFSSSDVSEADFDGADITGCDFSNVDLESAIGLGQLFEDGGIAIDGDAGSVVVTQSGHIFGGNEISGNVFTGGVVAGVNAGVVSNLVVGNGGVRLNNGWVSVSVRNATSGVSQSGALRTINGVQLDTRVIDVLFFDALLRIESLGGGRARLSLRTAAMQQSGQTNEVILARGQTQTFDSPYEARIEIV